MRSFILSQCRDLRILCVFANYRTFAHAMLLHALSYSKGGIRPRWVPFITT